MNKNKNERLRIRGGREVGVKDRKEELRKEGRRKQ